MKLIDKLKDNLEKNETKITVRGEISGCDWAEVRVTNIVREPIRLGTPVSDLSIGIQRLISGSDFQRQNYRIDNAHGSLHFHSGLAIFPMEEKTMYDVLSTLFGRNF